MPIGNYAEEMMMSNISVRAIVFFNKSLSICQRFIIRKGCILVKC